MLTVTKEFVFDSAHMLAGHEGLCKNVHGHTYKVLVEVKGTNAWYGGGGGMVVDFKSLKEILKEELFDKLDHAFIFDAGSKCSIETEIADTFLRLGLKTYAMPERPTAEHMAVYFGDIIEDCLIHRLDNVDLVSVTVYETPTSFAKYWK